MYRSVTMLGRPPRVLASHMQTILCGLHRRCQMRDGVRMAVTKTPHDFAMRRESTAVDTDAKGLFTIVDDDDRILLEFEAPKVASKVYDLVRSTLGECFLEDEVQTTCADDDRALESGVYRFVPKFGFSLMRPFLLDGEEKMILVTDRGGKVLHKLEAPLAARKVYDIVSSNHRQGRGVMDDRRGIQVADDDQEMVAGLYDYYPPPGAYYARHPDDDACSFEVPDPRLCETDEELAELVWNGDVIPFVTAEELARLPRRMPRRLRNSELQVLQLKVPLSVTDDGNNDDIMIDDENQKWRLLPVYTVTFQGETRIFQYTQNYNWKAHKALAKEKLAPQLFHVTFFPDDWVEVQMESMPPTEGCTDFSTCTVHPHSAASMNMDVPKHNLTEVDAF